MKKLILVLVMGLATLAVGYSQKTKDFVYLGQMYNTFEHAAQTKLIGKVKEFKQTTFHAEVVDGKNVKGKRFTTEESKALLMMRWNFEDEFNPDGTILRSTRYDDDGKIILDIKVEAEGKIIKRSEYYNSDTLTAYVKYKYAGGDMVELIAYNPVNDTIYMSVRYAYDQNGKIIQNQTFNYKNEPQGYQIRTRNENGQEVKIENYNSEGKQTSQFDNVYNEKGERVATHHQYITSKEKSEYYTFKYEYDKMGNYTAIIIFRYNLPFIYREREIKYYE